MVVITNVLERFAASRYNVSYRKPGEPCPRIPFARIRVTEFAAFGRQFGLASVLFLEMLRLSGLRRVQKRDGWVTFTQRALMILGLSNRSTLAKAVAQLVRCGFIEVRTTRTPGQKLEYRLVPGWGRSEAEVVDLASRRQAKQQWGK
jgi:hypothetical protein